MNTWQSISASNTSPFWRNTSIRPTRKITSSLIGFDFSGDSRGRLTSRRLESGACRTPWRRRDTAIALGTCERTGAVYASITAASEERRRPSRFDTYTEFFLVLQMNKQTHSATARRSFQSQRRNHRNHSLIDATVILFATTTRATYRS